MIQFKKLWELFGPQLAKPIFGVSLGGGKEGSDFKESTKSNVSKSSTGSSTQTTNKTTTADQTKSASESATQQTSGLETLSTLDEETQQLLTGLLADLAGGGSSAELAEAIKTRGLNAEETLPGLVDPIVAGARQNLETELGQSMQSFARAAGSSQNSLVQQLGLEEARKVETELAGLAASLGLEVQSQITEQQQAGVGVTETLVGQLAEVLKGANQTATTTESTSLVSQLQELIGSVQSESGIATEEETLNEIINAIENVKGSGSTSGVSGGLSIGI